jgi:hypothetical protein
LFRVAANEDHGSERQDKDDASRPNHPRTRFPAAEPSRR